MEDLDNQGRKPKRRTLDLSLAQVAASALAAVVGAVLASQLGVYGTILGAAVVSIGATTGTAVFQHLFRRTGEQLREMKTTPNEVEHSHLAAGTAATEGTKETLVFDPFDPGGDRTRMMARINPPDQGEAVAVYRGRSNLKPKSWKVYAVTATIVFALAMGTVGVIELASGKPASHLFDGGSGGGAKPDTGRSAPADPSQQASTDPTEGTGSGNQGGGNASPDSGTSASPHPGTSTSPDPIPANPTPTPHSSTGNSGSGSGGSGDAATPQAPQAQQTPHSAPSP